MIEAEFTDEAGQAIVSELQKAAKAERRSYCSSHVVQRGKPAKWYFDDVGCYISTQYVLQADHHPDHFGIFYGGWKKPEPNQRSFLIDLKNSEAEQWVEALLDPKGMFAPVLPFLWHTEPKEILSDCGFVFKNVLKSNAGLLWTFMQATRLMFENPYRMERFIYLRKHRPEFAVLGTLTLQPFENSKPGGVWCPTMLAHGEPLGTQGWRRAGYVLAGQLTPVDIHGPGGSARCFGGHMDINYRTQVIKKPLATWIELFQKAAKDGGLVKT